MWHFPGIYASQAIDILVYLVYIILSHIHLIPKTIAEIRSVVLRKSHWSTSDNEVRFGYLLSSFLWLKRLNGFKIANLYPFLSK